MEQTMKSLSDTWASVMNYCRSQINEIAFKTWLEPLNLVDFDGETATISTIDEFPKRSSPKIPDPAQQRL